MVTSSRLALGGLLLVALLPACSTTYAETALEPDAAGAPGTGGSGGSGGGSGGTSGTEACPVTLEERLSVTSVEVDTDIRYKRRGYDWFPTDERLALAAAPTGELAVAWLDNLGRNVHVTPLTSAGERSGEDVVLPGVDVGGLVARQDGFMLLTRREDPGEPLPDPAADGEIATAALLVRVRDGAEIFAAPLTGTTSIVDETRPDHRRDCASVWLNGRLAFNGTKYGAYFQVHGCEGNWSAPFYGDKLVYADDDGAWLEGGWEWNCSINQGLRLLPETETFTPLCMSDGAPFPGLNLVVEGTDAQNLAPEMTTVGYSAGQFGSVVKLADGSYVVGWLSRGVTTANGAREAAKAATDIAIVRLGRDRRPSGPVTWVVETAGTGETNLHLAAYGPDRVLVVWDSFAADDCSMYTCFGQYVGTYARLIDLGGNSQGPDELIELPPNSADDIVALPNGDLAWAFVPEPERNYDATLPVLPGDVPDVPPRRELAVARLRYCR